MHTSSATYRTGGISSWFRRAEDWLDARGRKAWIAAMVLGFIFVWPVGLALMAYMIWGKKMFGTSCRHHGHFQENARSRARDWGRSDRTAWRGTGNATFDAYKTDTLRRLEDEQEAFESFLQRLRAAKDKTEFDSSMDDRARRSREAEAAGEAVSPATPEPGDTRRGEY